MNTNRTVSNVEMGERGVPPAALGDLPGSGRPANHRRASATCSRCSSVPRSSYGNGEHRRGLSEKVALRRGAASTDARPLRQFDRLTPKIMITRSRHGARSIGRRPLVLHVLGTSVTAVRGCRGQPCGHGRSLRSGRRPAASRRWRMCGCSLSWQLTRAGRRSSRSAVRRRSDPAPLVPGA